MGKVSCGYGVATWNLMPVEDLIEARIQLAPLLSGTLNLQLSEPYVVRADARILPQEYGKAEGVKLQRCLIRDPDGHFHKAIITRPESHEMDNVYHGPAHFEVMGVIHFCKTWNLRIGDEIEVQVEGDDAWWHSAIGGNDI
ncbi:MAG TPA: hypothetical protein VLY24_30260 [Bryobacteraceae bacterium]|nr:hypothetical protein [Bryobacteraceae bacterium]